LADLARTCAAVGPSTRAGIAKFLREWSRWIEQRDGLRFHTASG
jgi:hypothetical protein